MTAATRRPALRLVFNELAEASNTEATVFSEAKVEFLAEPGTTDNAWRDDIAFLSSQFVDAFVEGISIFFSPVTGLWRAVARASSNR